MPSLSLRITASCALLAFAIAAPAWSQTQPATDTAQDTQASLPPMLQDFGAYVDNARKTFNVPGIADSRAHRSHLPSECQAPMQLHRCYGPCTARRVHPDGLPGIGDMQRCHWRVC